MTTIELLTILNQNKDISFHELLRKIPEISFTDYLEMLLEREGISKSEFIKRTNLERTYAYQIINGTRLASKDKVLQCAFALKLDLHDTNVLLTLSNNQNLYPKIKRDALIIFGINRQYNLLQMNDLLDEYQFSILD